MRKSFLIMSVFLLVFTLSGCTYFNVSVADITNSEEGKISRTCSYWSGFGDRKIVIEKDGQEINFVIDMTEGTLTLTLVNSDGEEVYALTKEGECKEVISYTAEESGRYILKEKGSKFKGSYQIIWSDEVNTE